MSHCARRPEETLKLRSSHVPVPISQREVSETCPARAGRGLLKFSAHPQECVGQGWMSWLSFWCCDSSEPRPSFLEDTQSALLKAARMGQSRPDVGVKRGSQPFPILGGRSYSAAL